MDTGVYISGVGHLAVIGWALLGSSMSSPVDPVDFKMTEVSVISETEFAALVSDAPAPDTDVSTLVSPSTLEDQPTSPSADDLPNIVPLNAPDAPQSAGESPDLTSIAALPGANALVDAPELSQETTTDQSGVTLLVPTAPVSDRDSNGRNQPDQMAMVTPPVDQPAPRVDSSTAPPPEEEAEVSNKAEAATTPDENGDAPVEEPDTAAPEQSATEIVTEAEQTESSSAPVKSSRPKGRPAKLAENTSTASEIEKALAQEQAEDTESAPAAPSGPPLTNAEKDGLRFAVQQCWNVNPTSESARITVVISFAMADTGQPLGNTIRLLSASEGSDSAQRSAYDAARRAIMRCANGGYKLPVAKYDYWRDIEMTFNPERMRIK